MTTPASAPLNVLGLPLAPCSSTPPTGFFRDGCCRSDPDDAGQHVVCAVMTDEFLQFSAAVGNDLATPRPQFEFPGLKAGDRWCLCVLRWKEAYLAGVAPPVVLQATHLSALGFVSLDQLRERAADLST